MMAIPKTATAHTIAIGERLKLARVDEGVTQKELGKLCGLTEFAISHFECGRRGPSARNLAKLCKALRVSADYILGIHEWE